jgi:hypothetical protein
MASSRLGLGSRRRTSGEVPWWWDTSPSVAADLHRRMRRSLDFARRAVATAGRRGVPTEHYDRLCDELAVAADTLDDRLVAASELPLADRPAALHDLRARVAELERTGSRVGCTALEAAAPLDGGVDEPLRRINERLDRQLEARAEVRELDAG